ncbi:MAG TPA: T9SS type A sorting domain-containing protein [Candidatus Syntrophosphaera sp.]|mgnify:CR=1 FL=1|nr:T9SS type A sorting domain-containing protein [Candidatus Syntrophosphaera sp.]
MKKIQNLILCLALLCGVAVLTAQTPEWQWATGAEGTGWDRAYGIALDGEGNACVTGCFEGTAAFSNHTLTANGGYVDTDIFVAKLGNVTPVDDVLAPEAVARLHDAWPNPLSRGRSAFIKADITERSKGTLSVFNQRGQSVARHELGPGTHQIPFSGDGLPAGVYLYSLQCGAYRETKKLVLLK